MTRADRVLTLVVALVCAFALGAAGTSLESAVSTSPDDVVDVEDTGLPISKDKAAEVRDQVEKEQEEPDKEEAQQQQQQEEQQQQQQQQQRQPQAATQSTEPSEPSLWQQLLALLRDLFPYIAGALVVVALAVAAYKQRHRLLALFAALLDAGEDDGDAEIPERGRRPLDFAPENDVDAAWVRLVSAVGERAGSARTTREYERAAVDAGLDPDAVSLVTRTFEEVRYGGQPVTDERRRRANEGVQRLGLGGGSA